MAESRRACTALIPVWCEDPCSSGSAFRHQLQFGTKRDLSCQRKEPITWNLFRRETTSERASANVELIVHRPYLNLDVYAKYLAHCHTVYAHFSGYLRVFQSSIAHRQCFDGTTTIIRDRRNVPSNSGFIFQRRSAKFRFSDPSGDSCI